MGQKTVTIVSGSFREEFRILLFEELQKNLASLEQLRSSSSGSFLPLSCSVVITVIKHQNALCLGTSFSSSTKENVDAKNLVHPLL